MSEPAESLYATEAIRLRWHPDHLLLEFTWLSFVSGSELHEAFDRMLALSVERGARRWLTDFTAMSAMRLADQNWLVDNLTPRVAQQITLARSAMVRPDHPMGAWFMDSMLARVLPGRVWPLRGFATRAAAYVWLVDTAADAAPGGG